MSFTNYKVLLVVLCLGFCLFASALANGQAIITTPSDGNKIFVLPDPLELPLPCQIEVSGLPPGFIFPHGLDYFGPDNALVPDFQSSRIFNVQISTASVTSTIYTGGSYTGTGSIAVAPAQDYALASGTEFKLAVIAAPFVTGAAVSTVALPPLNKVHSGQTQGIIFNAAGRAFVSHYASGGGGGISVLDPPYSSITFTIPMPESSGGAIALTPDGNTLLATEGFTNNLNIFTAPFSATSIPQVLSIPGASGLNPVRITPDGTQALVGGRVNLGPLFYAISAPFSASSSVEQIPLPPELISQFEDIGISSDGQLAIATGQSGYKEPAMFIRPPFTAAGAVVDTVEIGSFPDNGRGNGAVRFRQESPTAGLAVFKCAPTTTTHLSNLIYEVSVINNAVTAAANVVLSDPLPAGTSFVSASDGGTFSAGAVTWNLGTLAAQAKRAVSFIVQVDATSGTIDNQNYSVEADGFPTVVGPLFSTRVIPLSISKSGPDSVVPGDEMIYTIDYGNHSGADLTNVVLRDRLPSSTFFESATDGGTYSFAFGFVTWNLGTVPAGTTGQVSFTVDTNQFASRPIENRDYFIEADGLPQENGKPVVTTLTPKSPDLSISKSGPPTIISGSDLTYTITYGNSGSAGATNVVITDPLPAGTTFVSATDGGVLSNGQVSWNIGSLGAGVTGQTVSFNVQVNVTSGTIDNLNYTIEADGEEIFIGSKVSTVVTKASNVYNELYNIATRADVGIGNDIAIAGFIITGSGQKCVIVRGRGPSVGVPSGVTRLPDPTLTLKSGSTTIAENDNWTQQDNPDHVAIIEDLGKAPGDLLDAAIYICLDPGAYTVLVRGYSGTTGVGIAEVLDVDDASPYLRNIATRAKVGTGHLVTIAGFIITGNAPKQILIRGRGPSVGVPAGVTRLPDPTLTLKSGQTTLGSNDNWEDAANAADISATGRAPGDPLDSAIMMVLQPGAYTAILRGAGGVTGSGIVEVLDLTGRQ